MKKLFSIFGGLFMVSACTAYFFQIRNGSSIPNPATLFLWILIDTVNLISYFFTTGKDNWKALTAYVATILAFFMFIYSLVFGKFASIGLVEIAALAGAIIISYFYIRTKNHRVSNMMIQVIFLISYVPVAVGILTGTLVESPPAWILGIISYVFMALAVVVDYNDWLELAYPIANGIIGNGVVAILAIIMERS